MAAHVCIISFLPHTVPCISCVCMFTYRLTEMFAYWLTNMCNYSLTILNIYTGQLNVYIVVDCNVTYRLTKMFTYRLTIMNIVMELVVC